MAKKDLVSLPEGKNPNAKGRPKGALNKYTAGAIALKEMAMEKSTEAFTMLWEAFVAGDPDARRLYFTELTSINPQTMRRIQSVHIPEDQIINEPEIRLELLKRVLNSTDTLSYDEVFKIIQLLTPKAEEKNHDEGNYLTHEEEKQVILSIKAKINSD